MPGDINIAAVAALFADTTRVNILVTLSDGRALPAGELARAARVSPSTASLHLAKLVEGQLLIVEKQGRHRYFRLAHPAIVSMLEELSLFAPDKPIHSLREATAGDAVRRARMCYNHLAGRLGVQLTRALLEKQILCEVDEGYNVSEYGRQWLDAFGLDGSLLKQTQLIFVPRHIDWSERYHHCAGTFGAALAQQFFARNWLKRIPTSRAISVTEPGKQALLDEFGLQWNG